MQLQHMSLLNLGQQSDASWGLADIFTVKIWKLLSSLFTTVVSKSLKNVESRIIISAKRLFSLFDRELIFRGKTKKQYIQYFPMLFLRFLFLKGDFDIRFAERGNLCKKVGVN